MGTEVRGGCGGRRGSPKSGTGITVALGLPFEKSEEEEKKRGIFEWKPVYSGSIALAKIDLSKGNRPGGEDAMNEEKSQVGAGEGSRRSQHASPARRSSTCG